jgi:geranylgeranylglycerol-phosphate geranylgeranyltransferase
MFKFIKSYIKSMRLYYAFLTGIPGWIGVSFYVHIATHFNTVEIIPPIEKKIIILLLLFLSWGINQIINDFLGLKEDRINAPERPMVTGDLNPVVAIIVSSVLIMATAFITWFYLEPIAIIPLLVGVIANIIYEYAKGYGIMGNIVFGFMIMMCPVYGFLASGPTTSPYFTSSRISVLLLIWIINGIMTYYTYFKDYRGDKITGKNTLIVKLGIKNAKIFGIIIAFLPAILFLFVYFNNYIMNKANQVFILLGLLSIVLQVGTGILFFRNPSGIQAYNLLSVNFRACTGSQAALIALYDKELALILYLFSYVFISIFFHFYDNPKA